MKIFYLPDHHTRACFYQFGEVISLSFERRFLSQFGEVISLSVDGDFSQFGEVISLDLEMPFLSFIQHT